jgi:hypothetical protein
VAFDDGKFNCIESVKRGKVSSLLQQWQFKKKLNLDIWDIFNDHLNFSVTTWKELVDLNEKMLGVSQKIALLDPNNVKALAELKKFLENFEILQLGFGEVEALVQESPSCLEAVGAQLRQLNSLLMELSKNPQVKVQRDFLGSILLSSGQERKLHYHYRDDSAWKMVFRVDPSGGLYDTFEKLKLKVPLIYVVRTITGKLLGGRLYQNNNLASPKKPKKVFFDSRESESVFAFDIPGNKANPLVVDVNSIRNFSGQSSLLLYEDSNMKTLCKIDWGIFTPNTTLVGSTNVEVVEVEYIELFQ